MQSSIRFCRRGSRQSFILSSSSSSSLSASLVRINAVVDGSRLFFSTRSRKADDVEEEPVEQPQQGQPFVKTRLDPGEWDPKRTNPLYKPKYKSSSKIMSADDYANRPTVGLSGEFETMQDAMVVLSYLNDATQKEIYSLYLSMMLSTEKEHGRTSHEYVMRVIAQKYNIDVERVAAAVALQHNEQQMYHHHPETPMLFEDAKWIEDQIKNEIRDAYATYNLPVPTEAFVEDPACVNDEYKENSTYVEAPDIFDVDKMAADSIMREEKRARVIIDGHRYIEDADADQIPIECDRDCKKLLAQKELIQKRMQEDRKDGVEKQREKKAAVAPKWRTTNAKGESRPRWKYVAQIVNTRELKKKNSKSLSYENNSPRNTLVECDGELRLGTWADVMTVAWKPVRHEQEFIYQYAKRGWLDRIHRNDTKAWGWASPEARALAVQNSQKTYQTFQKKLAGETTTDDNKTEQEKKPKEEGEDAASADAEAGDDQKS